ncbi:MAG: hypothetical protein KIG14_00425 [Candidatus Sacchiramonaceae bacterium]|nr:hypothetical protein [Candidatus Saccharimonadaceae bacterium]
MNYVLISRQEESLPTLIINIMFGMLFTILPFAMIIEFSGEVKNAFARPMYAYETILLLVVVVFSIAIIITGLVGTLMNVYKYLKSVRRGRRIEFLVNQGRKVQAIVDDVKITTVRSHKSRSSRAADHQDDFKRSKVIIEATAYVDGVAKHFSSDRLEVSKVGLMPSTNSDTSMDLAWSDITVNDLNLPSSFDVYLNPDNMNEYYVDIRPILTLR